MSKWTDLRDAVEVFFTHTLWKFLQPFAAKIESGGSQILIAAAENGVEVGFSTPGTGEIKMAAALAAFSAEVVAKGVPFIESQARALIEVALQNKKAATATTVPATA